MLELLAETNGNELSIAAILGTICTLILTILNLYWTKGSAARIAEFKAKAELAALDVKTIREDCDRRITDAEAEAAKLLASAHAESQAREARMQAHIDIIDKKLDASETRERECLARASKMEGKLEVMERAQHVVTQKVEALEQKA